jgi:hypothetical protein
MIAPGLLLLAGCGSSSDGPTTLVKGKLLENGKPFTLDQSRIPLPKGATAPPPGGPSLLRISFIPVNGTEQFMATVDAATGEFQVPGTEGKGIKPGQYKVAITAATTLSPDGKGDYFGGKLSADKTPIVREVKPGEEIVIDVAKPQG